MKKKNKKKAYKWIAMCWPPDREILVVRNGEYMINFIKINGSQMVGELEVPKKTHDRLTNQFRNKDICAVGVSYSKYIDNFQHLMGMDV